MALPTALIHECRIGSNDANSGGFRSGGTGTDRTLQTAAHVVVDGATITAVVHTTTTQLTLTGYTVAATDVDNTYLIAGGTATAGLYHITAVDIPNNRWTMDRSVGTAAQTSTGNMGGAKATPGSRAGHRGQRQHDLAAAQCDAFRRVEHLEQCGRRTPDAGRDQSDGPGIDVTRGDFTANRPTIRATVNTMALVTRSANGHRLSNLILSAGSATGIQGLSTNANGLDYRVKITGATATRAP